MSSTRPALGMFGVFGRTGPPILAGRQFWHPLFSVLLLAYFLHLMNDDASLTHRAFVNMYFVCGGRGYAPNPAGELTAPFRVQTPVKHTSLHNRRGVLKCSKTPLHQTRISTIFRGTNPGPRPPLLDLTLNTMNCQLSTADPGHRQSLRIFRVV